MTEMLETLASTPEGEGCWIPRDAKAPRVARHLLRQLLAATPGGERFSEAAELVVSELVTNAVLHARVHDRLLWVGFRLADGKLRVEVHDAGEGRPTVRSGTELDESGRGLMLVELLSQAWGVCGCTGIGKCVWAVIAPARALE